MTSFRTVFASLEDYVKGNLEIVNDDPKHYAFSNIFDVAARAKPYEKVVVALNLGYVLEAVRAEGTSDWYAAAHDEFAIVMDGEVTFNFVKLADDQVPSHEGGAVQLGGEPNGPRMGRVVARRGHQVLLPKGSAYQLSAKQPGVAIMQTVDGPVTVKRWNEICTMGDAR